MTARRRLLFAIPSMALGGAERVFSTLLGSIDPDRYDLALASVQGGGPLLAQLPPHVQFVDLEASRVVSAMAPLVRLIRSHQPDVVVSTLDHMNLALCATRPLWPPAVRHVIRATSLVVLDRLWRRLAIRLLYPSADAIVFQSDVMLSRYSPLLGHRRPLNVVIGNPVDTAAVRERATEPCATPPRTAHGLRLVAVGRFEPVKGFDLLARALAQIEEPFTLTIVGDGGLTAPGSRLSLTNWDWPRGCASSVDRPIPIRSSPRPTRSCCRRVRRAFRTSCSKRSPWASRWSPCR